MKLSDDELYKKVDEILKENLGKDWHELSKIRCFIEQKVKDRFCIAGIIPSSFTNVTSYADMYVKAISISREEKDNIYTLTEKVIRRTNIVQGLKDRPNSELFLSMEEAEVMGLLSHLIAGWILPLEIFYSMEIEKISGAKLYIYEDLYDYLAKIVNFYLSLTDYYEKKSEEIEDYNGYQFFRGKRYN